MGTPLVSVVMPVRNAALFLRAAIDSILAQTFPDFELLLLNDASDDDSLAIMRSYSDSRIRIIDPSGRQGLVVLLNLGIAGARGKYVMRMDADDIALPARMEQQVKFLESHSDVGVCSSWSEHFDGQRVLGIGRGYSEDAFLKLELMYRPGFSHPTVMYRRDLFANGISYRVFHSDDYDLWTQLAFVTRFYKIPAVLLRYRLHGGQFTQQFKPTNREALEKVQSGFLANVNITLSPNYLALHRDLTFYQYRFTKTYLRRVACYFRVLRKQLEKNSFFDPEKSSRYADDQLYAICSHFTKQGIPGYAIYFAECTRFSLRKIVLLCLKSFRASLSSAQ